MFQPLAILLVIIISTENTKEHSFMIDILFFGLLLTHTVIVQ